VRLIGSAARVRSFLGRGWFGAFEIQYLPGPERNQRIGRVPRDSNARSLCNFPMQANGAEMLRLACCLGTEQGIEICAPVHDAVLICAPLDRLDDDVATTKLAMAEASRIVLNGFELGTDAHAVRYPDRYMDERGTVMWDRVMKLICERQWGAKIAAA
jgi:DNA polymerase I